MSLAHAIERYNDGVQAHEPSVFQPSPRRRFTADEVLAMVDAGVFASDDNRFELLDGELFTMSPQGLHHFTLVGRLNHLLVLAYGQEFRVQPQCNLIAGPHDLPEPDFAVYRVAELPTDRIPTAAHTVLIIEVAVSSQRRDRWKAGLYARAGAPEYWLIDAPAREVTVFRKPDEAGYSERLVLRDGDRISPPGLEVSWPVLELLP